METTERSRQGGPDDGDGSTRGRRGTKLAVVGAGSVGSTLAYAALMRGAARTVALYDIDAAKVEAEVLDIAHGIQFMPVADVVGSDDVAVCADADVVVVTAGAKQRPGQTRLDLAEATVALVRRIIPDLVAVAPDAVFLMVTNPVDIVTYAALKISGLPARQVFGSGTVLDSSRLRYLLARHTGVAVQNIHAYIAGEHGDSEIPLWSSATIGSVPLTRWPGIAGPDGSVTGRLTESDRERIAGEVVTSAYRIIAGKGATSSPARVRPTMPSPWPDPGSSRRYSATRGACSRSRRCSRGTSGSTACACRYRRWSAAKVSGRDWRSACPTPSWPACAGPPKR